MAITLKVKRGDVSIRKHVTQQSLSWDLQPSASGLFPPTDSYALSYDIDPPVYHKGVVSVEFKDSTDTPGWNVKERVYVVKKPRINLASYLRRPIEPRFFLPARKPIKPFKTGVFKFRPFTYPSTGKFFLERKLSYEIRLSKAKVAFSLKEEKRRKLYSDRLEKRRLFNLRYKALYERRMVKYRKRLAVYQVRLKKVGSWKHRAAFKRKRGSTAGLLPDNPYLHVKMLAISKGLRSVRFSLDRQTNRWPIPGGLGGNVYNNRIWSNTNSVDPSEISDLRLFWTSAFEDEKRRLRERSLVRLYKKISEQKVHVANFIAQRAQTVNLIASLSVRLLSLLKAKRFLLSTAGKYLSSPRQISNDYLAFQFGVKPLLSDIFSASEALSKISDAEKDTLVFSSGAHMSLDGIYHTALQHSRVQGILQARHTVRFGVSNQLAHSLQSYGLINPLEIAWEVLPWSFVVDWFLPIGQFIQNQAATAGLDFLTGTISYRFNGLVRESEQNPDSVVNLLTNSDYVGDGSDHQIISGDSILGDHTLDLKIREVLTELPGAPFPEFKSPFSLVHSLESAALFVQKVLRR